MIGELERFSLKYIDLLEIGQPPGLDCLNLDLRLAEHKISTRPVQLRTEIKERDLIHIVQIVSPAEAALPGDEKRIKGVLLEIDTIKSLGGEEPWKDLVSRLDEVYLACKKMFFSLMKPETVNRLEPEYEG